MPDIIPTVPPEQEQSSTGSKMTALPVILVLKDPENIKHNWYYTDTPNVEITEEGASEVENNLRTYLKNCVIELSFIRKKYSPKYHRKTNRRYTMINRKRTMDPKKLAAYTKPRRILCTSSWAFLNVHKSLFHFTPPVGPSKNPSWYEDRNIILVWDLVLNDWRTINYQEVSKVKVWNTYNIKTTPAQNKFVRYYNLIKDKNLIAMLTAVSPTPLSVRLPADFTAEDRKEQQRAELEVRAKEIKDARAATDEALVQKQESEKVENARQTVEMQRKAAEEQILKQREATKQSEILKNETDTLEHKYTEKQLADQEYKKRIALEKQKRIDKEIARKQYKELKQKQIADNKLKRETELKTFREKQLTTHHASVERQRADRARRESQELQSQQDALKQQNKGLTPQQLDKINREVELNVKKQDIQKRRGEEIKKASIEKMADELYKSLQDKEKKLSNKNTELSDEKTINKDKVK